MEWQNKPGQTHSPIPLLKPTQPRLGSRILIRGHNALQHLLGNIPQLIMLALDEQDGARRLRVERRRRVQDGFRHDVLDGGVGDGRGFRERVDAAAGLEGREERGAGGHGCLFVGVSDGGGGAGAGTGAGECADGWDGR